MGRLRRVATAAAVALSVICAACSGCSAEHAPTSIPVGAAADSETMLLAAVYVSALRSTGVPAHIQTVEDPIGALDTGAITVLPGFTGQLLTVFDPAAAVLAERQVYRALVGVLPEGIAAGDYATSAQDKPALAVTEQTAKTWGGTELQTVPRHCDRLSVGRLVGAATPASLGTCRLPAAHDYPDRPALFAAVRSGQLTAAWTDTTSTVPAGLVVLADRTPTLVRAENVVALYRRNELREPQLLSLNQVAGALDTATLVDMRGRVAAGVDPQIVTDEWLAEHPLWH